MNLQELSRQVGITRTWADTPLVAIDLETTGLSPWADGVTEIAVVVARIDDTGQIAREREFESLCDPNNWISPRITELTGITPQLVQGQKKFEDVWYDRIAPILPHRPRLHVAHNADFEASFLGNTLVGPSWLGNEDWWLDTCVLARAADRNLQRYSKGYRLAEVAERLGLQYQGSAHRAMPDADLCLRVLARLVVQAGWHKPYNALAAQRWWMNCAK
jgi:DNA polymerase-3 subunit alpha (Gram-positive type)